MGRKGRRRPAGQLPPAQQQQQADLNLPLANFVHSPEKRDRFKKSESGTMKQMAAAAVEIPDDWAERDDTEEEETTETGNEILVLSTKSLYSGKSTFKPAVARYCQLPLDFWHLVSRYILPEDVGRFALICRASAAVAASQPFWRGLCRRWGAGREEARTLPARLQPDCMARPRGLRAAAIRLLHLVHPPFLARAARAATVWPDPHSLTGRLCAGQRCSRVGRRAAYYYFTLREAGQVARAGSEKEYEEAWEEEEDWEEGEEVEMGDTRHLLARLTDIHHNTEEGCKLLQVTTASWAAVPPVLGLKLLGVQLGVALGMRYHKLRLTFGSPLAAVLPTSPGQLDCTTITLDCVASIKLLDWWSPQYQQSSRGVAPARPDIFDYTGEA